MPLRALRVRLTSADQPEIAGRGFYQLEEDALYVQIGAFDSRHRFFSFLDSDNFRMDFDKEGRLLFVELAVPRRNWPVEPGLIVPLPYLNHDVRWLDFRGSIVPPRISTSPDRGMVRLVFSDATPTLTIALASSVFLQVAEDMTAVALWVTHIEDDLAGRDIAAFRRKLGK